MLFLFTVTDLNKYDDAYVLIEEASLEHALGYARELAVPLDMEHVRTVPRGTALLLDARDDGGHGAIGVREIDHRHYVVNWGKDERDFGNPQGTTVHPTVEDAVNEACYLSSVAMSDHIVCRGLQRFEGGWLEVWTCFCGHPHDLDDHKHH